MKKVIERTSDKIAVFYDSIYSEEIKKLINENPGWITVGKINNEPTLFIRTGDYKTEYKYINVPTNYWLIITALVTNNGQIYIKKIKVISEEKFNDTYEILSQESDLFSGLEEDNSIKFENIKRKKA